MGDIRGPLGVAMLPVVRSRPSRTEKRPLITIMSISNTEGALHPDIAVVMIIAPVLSLNPQSTWMLVLEWL